ncbi:hypothetical protein EV649_4219 [Kribbella sp. VKM Ac-2569]|uniref:hypothetical protein n=1 Tax=Kribbella sp. VKM Ac-2569 TaxID=2512220 RepID=UPI00102C703C|nr:hypothetical protein [Kribbella sp. VKM Ac-2569]RZT16686.1 hypothetical protein EV649_4219 [Kribbella sp. VKM Ac-2569]
MSVEDQTSFGQPPPALPDGSMPTYDGHPLPGTGDGGPPSPPFGWGPDLDRFDQLDGADHHGSPHAESPLLIVALIILSGVAVSVLIAALAVRV